MEPVDNTPAIDSASTNVTNELDTSASPPSGPNNDQDNDDTSSELRKNPKLAHLRFRGFDENCEKAKEDTDSDDTLAKGRRFARINSLNPAVGFIDLTSDELKLKAALYKHICNPLKRWKVERIVPYKMILQIVKTVVVLVQVVFFTYMLPNNRAAFFAKSRGLFEHWFLKSQGQKNELYTQLEFTQEISYTIERYYQLPNITFGSYGYGLDSNGDVLPIMATIKQYKHIDINPSSSSIMLDSTVQTIFINITNNITSPPFDQIENSDFDWNSFIELSLLIRLKNIRIIHNQVDCYLLDIKVQYSNPELAGIIVYSLTVDNEQYIRCDSQTNLNKAASVSFTAIGTIIDLCVVLLCSMSMLFSLLKYWRGYKLGKAMGEFYHNKLKLSLTWRERSSLFSSWLLFTIISDILQIFGSITKILLDYNADVLSIYVRILLGTALLLESGTILRYISLFKQLNALTRTLSYVFPDLLKFLLCTSILYLFFSICGSLVFSPYNERFSDFSKSLQSLFVLTNGDDIFPMFRSFDETTKIAIIVYGQIFIYVFVALFVYAVLNLFTSLIINAHEMTHTMDRSTINEVRRFIFSGELTENGGALRDITHVHKYVKPEVILHKDDKAKKKHFMLPFTEI